MDELFQLIGDFGQYMFVTLFGDTDDEIRKTGNSLRSIQQAMIDQASREVDRSRAVEYAYLASLAYGVTNNGDQLRAILARGDKPLQKSYELADVFHVDFENIHDSRLEPELRKEVAPRGFLCYADDEILISIKGSSDLLDWLINFNLQRVESEIAHGGFMLLGSWIAERARPLISQIDPQQHRRIVLMGHSLGGAAAKCAAWFLKQETSGTLLENAGIDIFTFGAPDVFAEIDVHEYLMHDINEFSFATAGDMVANYPSEIYRTKYLLSGDCNLYRLDGSSNAHLLRVYEYVKRMYEKEDEGEQVIRLVMAKIRDSINSSGDVEQDPILQLLVPRKYPRKYFIEEHSIRRYISLLSHNASSSWKI